MGMRFGKLVDLHLLNRKSVAFSPRLGFTYHLEGIELFLDLLSKHRRKPITSCDVPSTIIVLR
jgi:hypothetical protein